MKLRQISKIHNSHYIYGIYFKSQNNYNLVGPRILFNIFQFKKQIFRKTQKMTQLGLRLLYFYTSE